ncbi:hypothetical protein TSUD_180560 [Trifolium subterraneum]|uniref:Endonuclease/exonuclease/phosphatase domain-containing protein n=1 Tax=Trifolium subterraneum TaxID=3900 RepID=A0A2Z6M8G2_TRISU|nr:hypothetical protein TSUD_180560 [Trifolium subterraneum]
MSRFGSVPLVAPRDFNDILSASEKKGRTDRAALLINGFRSTVSDAGLLDVHVESYPCTWFKSLGTERAVEERLDRALVNEQWFKLYPNAILENLPAPASDHYPILLTREPVSNNRRVISIFKFENAWLVDSDFHDYVHNRWHSYGHRAVIDKLDLCAKDFSDWNKNRCLHWRRDIDICRRKLDRIRTNVNPANVQKLAYFEQPSKSYCSVVQSQCKNSINIWNQTSVAQAVLQASEEQPDAAAVIFALLQQVDKDKDGIFAVIIWSIWNQRNDKVWRNKDTPQQTVISRQ